VNSCPKNVYYASIYDVKRRAIGEMARVLKKDGRVVILNIFHAENPLGKRLRFWFNLRSNIKGNWEFVKKLSEKLSQSKAASDSRKKR
jgi:ubiquinone/menaquinone biosynthesis C-methylase UbiE